MDVITTKVIPVIQHLLDNIIIINIIFSIIVVFFQRKEPEKTAAIMSLILLWMS